MAVAGDSAEEGPVRRVQKRLDRLAAEARGLHPRSCPLCGQTSMFAMFGKPPRYDARCTNCGSLERHRLFWLHVERAAPFARDHRVLHFAPEPVLTRRLRPLVGSYETADLDRRRPVTHHIDITATGLPDAAYDRIVCFHVLEHVDDRKALSEMFRILRPGGIAFLMTPVVEGWAETYENPAITTPRLRRLHFGQHDHVRYYGRDVRERIRAQGFVLSEVTAVEPDVFAHGLNRGETLFVAAKPG